MEMVDNYRQQQRRQIQKAVLRSAISAEDLQLTDDVVEWGPNGVVRRVLLTFRGSQLRVRHHGTLGQKDT